jgi:hypothetical protein
MGPDETDGDDPERLDIQLDELLSRDGPRDRSDDLYHGEW